MIFKFFNIMQLTWDSIVNPPKDYPVEYYHRVYDTENRIVTDKKYNSMKEIVENVYYNIPPDQCEHYLVKKVNNKETIIRLKCRGYE